MVTKEAILRYELKLRSLRYVGLRGNPRAKVWVSGEAPGQDEDISARGGQDGIPFIGYSGKLLDKMLSEVGFKPDEFCCTNPYKSRPPDNDIKRIGELGIPHGIFQDQFLEELRLYRPSIIVAAGKTSANILCPETKPRSFGKQKGRKISEEKEGFGQWRGSLLVSPLLDWPHYVIPMYHPAFVLRNYAEREISTFILARAFSEFSYLKSRAKLQPLPQRMLLVEPSFSEAYHFLKRCIASPKPISVDIELLRRKVPFTISFAINPWEAISMSFWNYPEDQLVCLWRLIDEILSKKWQIGQNYTRFDLHWLRGMGFSVNPSLVHDTLIRHHVLWPGLRHRLEFQTMQYTREPYYKDEGKGWTPRDDIKKLMRYNAKDSTVTYEIFDAQEAEFAERSKVA